SSTLLVTCLGIDSLVAYDALAASPARAERRRWQVAAGPVGVAGGPRPQRAPGWAPVGRGVDRGPPRPPPPPAGATPQKGVQAPQVGQIALSPTTRALPLNLALGRILFHSVGDVRISHDGRACASCHPDGRDDALTWATPNGPRRSIMLAGRVASTAPFSW